MAIRWTDHAPDPLPLLPGAEGPPQIEIAAAVEAVVLAHLRAHEVEQGGLLIGRAWRGGSHEAPSAVVRVQARGGGPPPQADGSAFALRMETSVWSAARALLAPGELIVGWYHSHPGLGAFFSATDRQTQAAFFRNAYSLGWVIDPVSGEEALFLGPECVPVLRRAAQGCVSRAADPRTGR